MGQKNKPFELLLWDEGGAAESPAIQEPAFAPEIVDVPRSLDAPETASDEADVASPQSDGWLGGSAGRTVAEVPTLFENPPQWTEHWKGMPKFEQRDLSPLQSIYVHFKNEDDRRAFSSLVGQTVTGQTRSIWYPQADIGRMVDKRYVDESVALDDDGPLLPSDDGE